MDFKKPQEKCKDNLKQENRIVLDKNREGREKDIQIKEKKEH